MDIYVDMWIDMCIFECGYMDTYVYICVCVEMYRCICVYM